MHKQRTGSKTAKGNQPQVTIEQFNARFAEFRSQFTLPFFDNAFLNIVQYAAISGRPTNAQIADGLLTYRVIRSTFIDYVYTTQQGKHSAEEITEVFEDVINFLDHSIEDTIGTLMVYAAGTHELDAEAQAQMLSLYHAITQVFAPVVRAQRIALAV
jgi:hypothetical protein